jgi:uncharacterized protein YabE (DUF348 family)
MQDRIDKIKQSYATSNNRHVRIMRHLGKKPLFTIPFATFMVLLVVVVVGLMFSTGGKPQNLIMNDSTVVVLNYDKQERTIPTRAKTVGELVSRLKVKINPGDVIEPSKNTEIIGDNFRVNIYRAVPVTIIDGEKKTFAYSAAATPRSIVKQAGVNVFPEDNLNLLPTENFLSESSIGERVVIDRATPITVNLYGTQVAMRTHAKTVGELIKEKKIKLGKEDTVQPAQNEALTSSSQVFLVRKGTQIQTVEEEIAAPVEEVQDDSLSFGATAVRQQGAPGKRLVTYQVNLQNGQEIGRTKIQEVVSQEPVKQVVAKGTHFDINSDKTALMTAAGIPKSQFAYADYIISRESGWCYTKWQGEYGGCKAFHGAPSSSGTGYGLCQATPGYKMSSSGGDWASNPITQLKWCTGYANSRYGGWSGAYNHWLSHHNW